MYLTPKHKTPNFIAYHVKSTLLALKTIVDILENNLKPVIFLGNFEISTQKFRDQIEEFIKDKFRLVLKPLKTWLHEELDESREWIMGLKQGFNENVTKLGDFIRMKWRVKLGARGLYSIVDRVKECEDILNTSRNLINDIDGAFGTKLLGRNLGEINSILSQVKVMMNNEVAHLGALDGIYAKGEEQWEHIILKKVDKIKNTLEVHYQKILDPQILTDTQSSSVALITLKDFRDQFKVMTEKTNKYVNYLKFLKIQPLPDFGIQDSIIHSLKYRMRIWKYFDEFNSLKFELEICRVKNLDLKQLDLFLEGSDRQIKELEKNLPENSVLSSLKKSILEYKEISPLVKQLRAH